MGDLELNARFRTALKQGNVTRIEECLDQEAVDPNMKFALDPSSHVPLTQAIEMDRSDIVKMLIAHPKINPNIVGNEGSTPLTLAVAKCSKEMVSMILSLPATDPNLKEGGITGGLSSLHLAVMYNNVEILKMLTEDKRIDTSQIYSGQTALEMAQSFKTPNQEIIEALKSVA